MTQERKVRRTLTPADEHGIISYYECGVPMTDIVETFDVTRMTVYRVLKRYGVKTSRK